jgi:hypothetical protein
MRRKFRVAEFDLAAAVQEDAEPDLAGVRRDLGGELVRGPRAGSGGGGEVAGGVVPGIRAGCPQWRGLAWAGGAECQSGAAVRLGGAQFGAEGDGAAAVVVGFNLLGEEGESGRFGHGRGQDRPPVRGGGGVVEPGALAQEGAAELPVVQAVGERQVAGLDRRLKGLGGVSWLRNWLSRSGPVTGVASRSMTGSSTASGAPVMTARVRPSARLAVTGRVPPGPAMAIRATVTPGPRSMTVTPVRVTPAACSSRPVISSV